MRIFDKDAQDAHLWPRCASFAKMRKMRILALVRARIIIGQDAHNWPRCASWAKMRILGKDASVRASWGKMRLDTGLGAGRVRMCQSGGECALDEAHALARGAQHGALALREP